MYTVKLNISDKVYFNVIEALSKFKEDVTIIEDLNFNNKEWNDIDSSEIKKTLHSIVQMQNGEVVSHDDVIKKHRSS